MPLPNDACILSSVNRIAGTSLLVLALVAGACSRPPVSYPEEIAVSRARKRRLHAEVGSVAGRRREAGIVRTAPIFSD